MAKEHKKPHGKIDRKILGGIIATAVVIVISSIGVDYLIELLFRHSAYFLPFYINTFGRAPYLLQLIVGLLGVVVYYKLVLKSTLKAVYRIEISLLLTYITPQLMPRFMSVQFVGFSSVNLLINSVIILVPLTLFLYLSYRLEPRLKNVKPVQLFEAFLVIWIILYASLYGIMHLRLTYEMKRIMNTQKQQSFDDAKALPFKLYRPRYTQAGSTVTPSVENAFEAGKFASIDNAFNDYPNNKSGYTISEFATPKSYNPPTDCSYYTPLNAQLHDTTPCVSIGKSAAGCEVYLVRSDVSNDVTAYCKLEGTMVTFSAVTAENINNEEVLKIFDSLQPVSADDFMSSK